MGAQIVDSVFTLSFDSIGTMTLGFFAVMIRNLNEKFHFYEFSIDFNDRIGDISLGLYLSMALLMLKLWELAELALPLLALLCVQTIVLLILTYYVLFRILGNNYDAAVMSAGLIDVFYQPFVIWCINVLC